MAALRPYNAARMLRTALPAARTAYGVVPRRFESSKAALTEAKSTSQVSVPQENEPDYSISPDKAASCVLTSQWLPMPLLRQCMLTISKHIHACPQANPRRHRRCSLRRDYFWRANRASSTNSPVYNPFRFHGWLLRHVLTIILEYTRRLNPLRNLAIGAATIGEWTGTFFPRDTAGKIL